VDHKIIRPDRSRPTTRPIAIDGVGWFVSLSVGLSVTIVSPAKEMPVEHVASTATTLWQSRTV